MLHREAGGAPRRGHPAVSPRAPLWGQRRGGVPGLPRQRGGGGRGAGPGELPGDKGERDGSRVGAVPVRLRSEAGSGETRGAPAAPAARGREWWGRGARTAERCPPSWEGSVLRPPVPPRGSGCESLFTTLRLDGRCERRPERSPAVSRYQGAFPSEPPPWVCVPACSRAEAAGTGRREVGTGENGALEEPGVVVIYPSLGVVDRAPPVGLAGAG